MAKFKVGQKVMVRKDGQIYFIKEIVDKWLVNLEYRDDDGEMVSGGSMDISILIPVKTKVSTNNPISKKLGKMFYA